MSITYLAAMREPLLPVEQERDALRRWQEDGDRNALELLLRSHARQAWSQASRWTNNPVHLEDLAAEGMIGLMRAADNFNRALDVRFSTYSSWWVMTSISTALTRVKTVIDIPPRAYIDARMGRLIGEEAAQAQMAIHGQVALDAPLGEDGIPAADRLPSPDLTPEEAVVARSSQGLLERMLHEALDALDPVEAEIIRRRKLKTMPDHVAVVATDLGMPRERLRQVENRALMRLRRQLLESGFHLALLN
ncbi:sigma-70 family RNA polymerase sigma factor [Actibacterium sp. MT2.3-13A]|uniref:sigma-70 family RNA polymerase sigma factor n=1 Tax=Actibacterium sp. MT2.3-13A TaxID=2828332 RepID=UPI001BADE87C|nr:sigma-70 family RNA polymerase sigma factor [Actibacterium sp. MT2.3-13A]